MNINELFAPFWCKRHEFGFGSCSDDVDMRILTLFIHNREELSPEDNLDPAGRLCKHKPKLKFSFL